MKKEFKENLLVKECPRCSSVDFVHNGTDKGIQKFKCSDCGRIFRNKNYTIKTKTDRKLISALINILESDIKPTKKKYVNYDILSDMKSTMIDNKRLCNTTFLVKSLKLKETFEYEGYNLRNLNCYNPVAIFCQVDNEIRIIKLPKYEFPEDENVYTNPEERIRKIRLVNRPDEEYTKNDETYINRF